MVSTAAVSGADAPSARRAHMTIEVELFGGLAPTLPRKQHLQPAAPVTAGELARVLGLPPDLVYLIMIDGVQSEPDAPAPDGSRVCFFPYLAGG